MQPIVHFNQDPQISERLLSQAHASEQINAVTAQKPTWEKPKKQIDPIEKKLLTAIINVAELNV